MTFTKLTLVNERVRGITTDVRFKVIPPLATTHEDLGVFLMGSLVQASRVRLAWGLGIKISELTWKKKKKKWEKENCNL